MQLSASTLPYDPPSASAADPALAADRVSRNPNSEAPSDGFGAMLVAKSGPRPAPTTAGAKAKAPSSPLGATVADGDETAPAQAEDDTAAAVAAGDAADPVAGQGVPDAEALANWLAANAVLAPLAATPVVNPAGLALIASTPEATGGVEDAASAKAESVCAAGLAVASPTLGLPAVPTPPGESAGVPPDAMTAETAEASVQTDPASSPASTLVRFGRLMTQASPVELNAAPASEAALTPAGDAQEAVVAQASTSVLPATAKPQSQAAPTLPTDAADTTAPEASIATGDLPANATEKFAALQDRFLRRYSIGDKSELKKSIGIGKEVVAGPSSVLGINAAQPVPAMPALTLTPSSDAAERVSAVPAPLTFDALVKDAATLPPTEVSNAASRAVDSVMAIADHFGTGGQRAVSLQFTVSGVELAVHVELRGNAVHTTFRTDSPELRAALAAEWQAVNPANSANRSQWIADPVFSSGSSGNGTSGNAGSSFQQHADARQGQPQPQGFAEDLARLRSPLRAAASTSATIATAPSVRPVVVTSTRLHAFA